MGNLGGMYEKLGRIQEGAEMLEQASAIARAAGDSQYEATHCRNLGQAYLQLMNPYGALSAFERAQHLQRELGMAPDPQLEQMLGEIRKLLKR